MPKILITGPPRCGKSTLILKLIEYYKEQGKNICGFLTPEVKEGRRRIGFDIIELDSGKKEVFARMENIKSKFRLGKYHVVLTPLEKIISRLTPSTIPRNILIFIDEIGKMELFSAKFERWLAQIFESSTLEIIATIGEKINHPIKSYILQQQNTILLHLSRKNQPLLEKKIKNLI
ncbi:MAG: nucleoside-triphosphatase [Promethearchaeota archaeon]